MVNSYFKLLPRKVILPAIELPVRLDKQTPLYGNKSRIQPQADPWDVVRKIDICMDEVLKGHTPTEALRLFAFRLITDTDISGYLPPMRVYIATFLRGELPPEMNENFIRTGFGRQHLAPIISEGQSRGEFKEGNPEDLADIYWYCLLGIMANKIHNKDSKIVIPDIDLVLSFLKE